MMKLTTTFEYKNHVSQETQYKNRMKILQENLKTSNKEAETAELDVVNIKQSLRKLLLQNTQRFEAILKDIEQQIMKLEKNLDINKMLLDENEEKLRELELSGKISPSSEKYVQLQSKIKYLKRDIKKSNRKIPELETQ